MVIWYIFPRFGLLCQETSGNPGMQLLKSYVRDRSQDPRGAHFLIARNGEIFRSGFVCPNQV
jgi:hypothetical protein